MLGKLIKYEFKATTRYFLPLYFALICVSFMGGITLKLGSDYRFLSAIGGLIMFAYVLLAMAIAGISFFIIIYRFYKNLLSEEGYLSFTLPVTPHTHIINKLIVSAIWQTLSVAVILLSIGIIVINLEGYSAFSNAINEIGSLFSAAYAEIGFHLIIYIIEFSILMLLSLLTSILMIYASIALGHLNHSHKILSSFAAYIAISFLLQIITVLIPILASIFVNPADYTTIADILGLLHIIFPAAILFFLIIGCIFFFITDYIFSHKLNLE
jgi:hypothetical protein